MGPSPRQGARSGFIGRTRATSAMKRQGCLLDRIAHLEQSPRLQLHGGTLAASHGLHGVPGFPEAHNHNFFRLWTWESALNPNAKQRTTSYDPLPYERVGPGVALDGKPKFDITRYNQAYFDRLRARVEAARQDGIYVSVMLFQGFSIEGKGNVGGDPWKGHPFNPDNNVSGFDGGGRTKVHTLCEPALTALRRPISERSSTP